jgi:hypothetical protein
MIAAFLLFLPTIYAITLPPLLGLYEAGTRRVEIAEKDRLDALAPTPQPRILMLQLWYPISHSSSSIPAPWIPTNAAPWEDQELEMPAGTFESITTNTWSNSTSIFPTDCKV